MTGEQGVRERPQPDQPPAHRATGQKERRHAARHDDVGHRRTAAVQEGRCIGHRANIGIVRRPGYRPLMALQQAAVSLRAMEERDAPTVAALIRSAFACQFVVTDPPPSALRVTEDDVATHLQVGGGAVAERGGRMVGSALWNEPCLSG